MNYSKVRLDQFNLIREKTIQMKECPKCSFGGGEVVLNLQWYSKLGVRAQCPRCGYHTKRFPCTLKITDGRRFATVCIQATVSRAIRNAIRAWNKEPRKRVEVEEYDIDDGEI